MHNDPMSMTGRVARRGLTHLDADGSARMVDVGDKLSTRRRALASGRVIFGRDAFRLLRANRLAKGDAIAVARLAGIQAAKRVPDLVPLCHQVPLDHVDVSIVLRPRARAAVVTASTSARWTTGVEMEALAAVAAACLALYDMAKGVDRGITIETIRLEEKSGGRTGLWNRAAGG